MADRKPPWRALAEAGPGFPILERGGTIDWGAWKRSAEALEARLLPDTQRNRRIHHLYVPMLFWLLQQLDSERRGPVVVGLCAPQGAGKSTLVRELLPRLRDVGCSAVAVSIDDFYLPREAQLRLAAEHPGNRFLEHRGAPGSHDLALGDATLEALRHLGSGATMRLPVYDKSAHGGRGERLPPDKWPVVSGPFDLVLVEGWCLAFQPVPEMNLSDEALRPVNAFLAGYTRWQSCLDSLASWRALALEQIVDWRVEAEARASAAGRPSLDRAASEDYIRRFIPLYETYQSTVTLEPPPMDRQFRLVLDASRLPTVG